MLASGPLIGENFWHCLHHNATGALQLQLSQDDGAAHLRPSSRPSIPSRSTSGSTSSPSPPTTASSSSFATSPSGASEEALRESEARYRLLTELNPQMIWMASDSGGVNYANQRLLDYTGLSLEQATDDDWLASDSSRGSISPAHRPGSRIHGTGEMLDIQLRLKQASDGEYRWFLCRALPVPRAIPNMVSAGWASVSISTTTGSPSKRSAPAKPATVSSPTSIRRPSGWAIPTAGSPTPTRASCDYLGFTTADSRPAGSRPSIPTIAIASSRPGPTPSPPAPNTISKPA